MNVDKRAFSNIPKRIVGREGVGYFPHVVHLVVKEASTEGEYLRIRCNAIRTRGLIYPSPSDFELMTCLGLLTARPMYLAASYVGWKIFFDPAVIDRVISIASQLPAGKTYNSDYTHERGAQKHRKGNIKFIGRSIPGSIASSLFSYLDEQVNFQNIHCANILYRPKLHVVTEEGDTDSSTEKR